MSQIQKYVFELAAGEEINPSVPQSDFIGCTSSSTTFKVYPDGKSPITLENGLSIRTESMFNSLRIRNTATSSQIIELYVGSGDLKDSRLIISGGLPVAGNASADYGAVTVGTSATLIKAAETNRSKCLVQNNSAGDIYVGNDASVTTANGVRVKSGATMEVTFQSAIYAIGSAAGLDVRFINEVT